MGMGSEEKNIRSLESEEKEFAKMRAAIKDIDYYKSETEAARNGQTAAMEFADAKATEATQARNELESYKELIHDRVERAMPYLIFGFLMILLIVFEIGRRTS